VSIKEKLKQNYLIGRIFAPNVYNRDSWVKKEAAKIKNNAKVLDIGAGSSPYRDYFRHTNYFTQDFSQLENYQLRGNGYSQIDFISDIRNIPVENDSFDVILCTEVFEHIPYPIESLKEISRILKSGGILLFTAPLGSGLHQQPFHFYGGYTPFWYDLFLNENKFENIEITANGGFYTFFAQEFLRFLKLSLPWKSVMNLIISPIWLLLSPFGILLALLAPLLDKFSKDKNFTVGYHVKAIKL
jgi:SAM-dependent methyltransferase